MFVPVFNFLWGLGKKGWELTKMGKKGTLWGGRNILYFDRGLAYTVYVFVKTHKWYT